MSQKSTTPVGIDLGTTFSVVAYLDARGVPKTVLNSEGDLLTPSVVLFEDHGVTVGKEAQRAAPLEPERIADFAKRDMGEREYHRKILGQGIPPEVIQSLILKRLKTDAEETLGPIEKVVITVPAYFNEPRRKATQDAGRMADLDVIDIINEPTAAAIAYGAANGFLDETGQAHKTERILVYDLGGGTFDVTVMEIKGREFRTLATDGDVYLGGIDWDQALMDLVADEYARRHGFDPRTDPGCVQRLRRDAEEAKRALTAREQTTIGFEHAGKGLRANITRKQFEDLTAGLLERTVFTTRSVLKDVGLTWNDLTRVLLVGGSTRMPAVRKALQAESGGKVERSVSTDEAVAHGAALYAGVLLQAPATNRISSTGRDLKTPGTSAKAQPEDGRRRDEGGPALTIRNVSSHNLGVLGTEPETGRPKSSVIIPRNTSLPVTQGKRFRTAKKGQKSVLVQVVEGGDSGGRNATHVGKCVIRDLPDSLPAGTSVDVLFTYGTDGRLTVKARLPDHGKEATLVLERNSGLSDELMNSWKNQFK